MATETATFAAVVPGYVTAGQAAEIAGLRYGTFHSYVVRGQAPGASLHIGRTPLWLRTDIEAWRDARPGQGARTDLKRDKS